MDTYNLLKSLHIIFIVTWFAGLFYIVRLFVYHVEASSKDEPEKSILSKQYGIMERRLWYGIAWPSMIITLILGTSLLYKAPYMLKLPFMHLKLGFVFILILYHLSCQMIYGKLRKGTCKFTSTQLRIWNEVATLILVSVVFLIVMKNTLSFVWGTVGLVLFAILLMISIRIYKTLRKD